MPIFPPSFSPTTANDLLAEIKQHLYTGQFEIRDKLDAAIPDATATTFTLKYGNNVFQPGIRVSCELEDMHVWDINGKLLTVERGQFGSKAVMHPVNSLVYAAPRFSDNEMFRELNNEILSLSAPSSGIYSVQSEEIPTIPGRFAYPLHDTGIQGILQVAVRRPGTSLDWIETTQYRLNASASPSDFSTSLSIELFDPQPANTTIRVVYRAAFLTFTAVTDNASVSGLATSQFDIPVLGAVIRLTSGRELRRNYTETQGDTRRASEVPPGANMSAGNAIRDLYRRRLVAESERLYRLYPAHRQRIWNLPTPARRF